MKLQDMLQKVPTISLKDAEKSSKMVYTKNSSQYIIFSIKNKKKAFSFKVGYIIMKSFSKFLTSTPTNSHVAKIPPVY